MECYKGQGINLSATHLLISHTILRSRELILAFKLGVCCICFHNSIDHYNISIICMYLIYLTLRNTLHLELSLVSQNDASLTGYIVNLKKEKCLSCMKVISEIISQVNIILLDSATPYFIELPLNNKYG